MIAVNSNEKETNIKSGFKKLGSIIFRVLLYIGVAAVVIFSLIGLYKILEFLVVAAVLLIGFVGIGPRHWWW